MARRLLASAMTMGVLVTALGFNGVFAVFTDQATIGPNTADSGATLAVADLQLAPIATGGGCGTFVNALSSPYVMQASGLEPGGPPAGQVAFCLRNGGLAALETILYAMDLTDAEIGCTGDEALVETTCGSPGDGELSQVLYLHSVIEPCEDPLGGSAPSEGDIRLADLATNGLPGGAMNPGDCLAMGISAFIPTAGEFGIPLDWLVAAQSDSVTWTLVFVGGA